MKRNIKNYSEFVFESVQSTNQQTQKIIDESQKKINSGEKPDQAIINKLIDCIKKNKLPHLMVLTTGYPMFILGTIAFLVTLTPAAMAVGFFGGILSILSTYNFTGDGLEGEVKILCKCMGWPVPEG